MAALPGVTHVAIDAKTKTVTCTVEPSEFNSENAVQALADVKFKPTKVETPSA